MDNLIVAKVAVELVMEREELTIEKQTAIIHEKWFERNGEWAPENHLINLKNRV